MITGEKIYEKTFTGRTTKDAYLKACKFMSQKIIGKDKTKHIVHKIEKTKYCEVKLTLYAEVEESEIMDNMCSVCKQAHAATFLKEDKYQCELCKILPYKKRAAERLKRIKEYMLEGIEE